MNHTQNFLQRLKKLNPAQLDAVNSIEGPVIVIAGPGTGKTEIIGMRVANILHKIPDISPNNILVITFTESGVKAIKQRLLQIIGPASYQVKVSTFHGFCNEVIGDFPEKFLFAKNLSQLDEIEKIEIINGIIDNSNLEHLTSFGNKYYFTSYIIKSIGDLKREDITPDKFKEIVIDFRKEEESNPKYLSKRSGEKLKTWEKAEKQINKLEELVGVFVKYEEELKKKGKYDFEDMILFVVNKMKNDDELLAYYQEKYQYILADEYQDTNSAQNEVLTLLASTEFSDSPNVFVVGDDDQSIYRFQGASVENILFFEKQFPNVKKIILTENYRSTQIILDAAKSLIENNASRISNIDKSVKKELIAKNEKKGNSHVQLNEFPDDKDEKIFLLNEIKKLISGSSPLHPGEGPGVREKVNPNEIAVFTRTNSEVDSLASFFIKNEIPIKLSSGENILKDKFIQIVLDYLKVINDPYDDEKLYRICFLEINKIKPVDFYKISQKLTEINYGLKWKKHYFDIISTNEDLEKMGLESKENIVQFVQKISDLKIKLSENSFLKFFEIFIHETGLLKFIRQEGGIKALNKINSLFNKIGNLNKAYKDLSLKKFLEILEIYQEFGIGISEEEFDTDTDGVNIMTAHKSKGLEFEYCFITSCVDKKWGNRRNMDKIKLPLLQVRHCEKRGTSDEAIQCVELSRTNDEIDLNGNKGKSQKLRFNLQDGTNNGDKGQGIREDDNEDERRLFFVALTRAKKQIYITYPNIISGEISEKQTIPSQFIAEINEQYLGKTVSPIHIEDKENYFMRNFSPINYAHEEENEQLKSMLAKFKLSFTSFSAYRECPLKFKNRYLLAFPEVPNKHMILGGCVHKALEKAFVHFKEKQNLPNILAIKGYFDEALKKEIVKYEEMEELIKQGHEILEGYFNEYKNEAIIPFGVEYNFGQRNIYLDEVPLTGKIDKLEIIGNLGSQDIYGGKIGIKIIDYKTGRSKSENEVLGETKSSDGKLKKQLTFYKLLFSLDPEFNRKFEVQEGEIDFVEGQNGKYKKIKVMLSNEDVEELKKEVIEVYEGIKELRFEGCGKESCEVCMHI